MNVEECTFSTNDGVSIAYTKCGTNKNVVILLHGWCGSRAHFDRNVGALSEAFTVYALDHRFHGGSDRPSWGHFVCRLAADVENLIQHLGFQKVAMIGVSMGCSVIWAYCMLFGTANIQGAIFIDQSPLQDKRGDWELGSKSCYDQKTLEALQEQLKDMEAFAPGFVKETLENVIESEHYEKMRSLTASLDGDAVGRLMADHTQIDWRPVLPKINVPCLNCTAGKSCVFPVEGAETVTRLIPNCKSVHFPEANHMIQIDEADKFNNLAIEFLNRIFS